MPGALLNGSTPISEREALMINPIRLAYIGDTVYDLLVRTDLVLGGGKVREMHRDAIRSVNAGAQAQALALVQG